MFLPQKKALEEHRKLLRSNLSLALWFVALDNGGLADLGPLDKLTLNHIVRSGYKGEPVRAYLGALVRIASALRAELTVKCINQYRNYREVTFACRGLLDDQVLELLPVERFSDQERARLILTDPNLELETLFDCAEIAGYLPFVWIDYRNERLPNDQFISRNRDLIGIYKGAVHA